MSFDIGDLVRLKSGSALMVAEEVENNFIFCVWTENVKGRQEVLRNRFHVATIEASKKPQFGAISVGRG